MVRVMLEPLPPKKKLETRFVLEEIALRDRLVTGVSASPIVKASGPVEVSSSMTRSLSGVMVGSSLTGYTVRLKLVLVINPLPSVTVRVMVTAPFALVSGRMVSVRLELLPPRVMLAVETKPVFEELATSARAEAAVSASPTVKLTVMGTSSSVVWLGMGLIIGESFTGL